MRQVWRPTNSGYMPAGLWKNTYYLTGPALLLSINSSPSRLHSSCSVSPPLLSKEPRPKRQALSTSHPRHQYPRELLYHMSLCQLESIPPHGPEMTGPIYHLISGAERRRCTKLCVFCKAQVAHPIPAAAGLSMLPHVTLGPLWLLQ